MALTNAQLSALNFGYLTGANLMRWASPSLLIKQLEVDPSVLLDATNTAYKEVISKLSTRYDLTTEFLKTGVYPASAIASITGGAVSGIAVTASGPGYVSAPTVNITPAAGDTTGTGAAATAIISPSGVTSIEVLNPGCRYTTTPAITISGGGGTGASAQAVLSPFGGIQAIVVTAPGSGYSSNPNIVISGNGRGAFAAATITFGQITGFTITAPGSNYTVAPVVTLSGGIATDLRNELLVKITAIFAVRNALGNFAGESDLMKSHFKWADKVTLDIRNGQETLSLFGAQCAVISDNALVQQRFGTLG